jgi:hypothetical protein
MTETSAPDDDSDLSYIERLALADPGTTLGKLQRGRGAGWLECLELPRSEANELLWQCIVFDPRVDQQIERREGYYAAIALLTDLDANRLSPENTPPTERWRDQRLVVEVLGELDRAGVPGAGAVLLEHLGSEDSVRDFVIPEVLEAGGATFEALPAKLVERRDDAQLAYTIGRWSDDFPWDRWAKRFPRVAMALRIARNETAAPAPRDAREPPSLSAPASELMAFRWWGHNLLPDLVTRLTADRRPGEYEELVRAAAELPVPTVPFGILGRANDPAGIDAALAILDSDEVGIRRGAARRYIVALGPEHALPLARSWVGTERQWLAAEIFEQQGEPQDIPAIRTCLADAWRERSIYPLCDLIDALGRLAEHGPFEELREIFETVEYSYARQRAASVMAASEPDWFAATFARECLWDCELETARLGIEFAADIDPAATRRVEAINAGRTGRKGARIGRLTGRDFEQAGVDPD